MTVDLAHLGSFDDTRNGNGDGDGGGGHTVNRDAAGPGVGELRPVLLREVRRVLLDWTGEQHAAGRVIDGDDRRVVVEEVVARFVAESNRARLAHGDGPLPAATVDWLREAMVGETDAFGPPTRFLCDGSLTDVHVNGAVNVITESRHSRRRDVHRALWPSNGEVVEWGRWLAATQAGRELTDKDPRVSFRLSNGTRVHLVYGVTDIAHATCRNFLPELDELDALAATGMFTPDVEHLLRAVVRRGDAALRGNNTLIAGGVGTGKTSLVRALANAMDPMARKIVAETERELFLSRDRHPDLVSIEARPANLAGQGAVTLDVMLMDSLRMHGDVIIYGEMTGSTVFGFYLAITEGVEGGSLATLHASSTREVFDRLGLYSSMAGYHLEPRVELSTIANALDLLVHVGWVQGRRQVTSIRAVDVYTAGAIATAEVFRWDPTSSTAVRTDEEFPHELAERLTAAGCDRSVLARATKVGYR